MNYSKKTESIINGIDKKLLTTKLTNNNNINIEKAIINKMKKLKPRREQVREDNL